MAGCVRVPTGRITADRMDFGQVIQQSWKRQTLLNIVRLRYGDAPMFLDVASVINSYTLGGSVSGGASLQKAADRGLRSRWAPTGVWSNTPTVTYQPLMGDRFTRSLLQPVAPAAIFQLMQGGLSPELVLATLVRSINGLRNDSFGVAGDPGFHELVGALARIQRAGGPRQPARSPQGRQRAHPDLPARGRGRGRRLQDVRRVRELLGLDEKASARSRWSSAWPRGPAPRWPSSPGRCWGSSRSWPWTSRCPAAHAGQAAGRSPSPGKPETPGRPRACASDRGTEAPEDAYAAVPYEGYWYWIDNADLSSKRTFTFLLILFSLAETGAGGGRPGGDGALAMTRRAGGDRGARRLGPGVGRFEIRCAGSRSAT